MRPEFGTDLTNVILRQSQIIHTRMAGRAVIKVVERCNTAKENNNLNLSECQLCTVPDAVYHLMRNTSLTMCNLSDNLLSKIPSKFSIKFPLITELNLSHNKISALPDELRDCGELVKVDISHNSYTSIPPVLFRLPKIQSIKVTNNFIMDVNRSEIPEKTTLKELDLRENPLSNDSHALLSSVKHVTVTLTPLTKAEWDDL